LTPTVGPRVRLARDADAPAVLAVWDACFVTDPTAPRAEPHTRPDFDRLARDGGLLVAELDGAVVGAVGLSPPAPELPWTAAGEALVARLGVLPTARRAGVARALMAACACWARELGLDAVVLTTRPAQRGAHVLYEALGYGRVVERDHDDARGRCLVYRRELVRAR
jgi:GNAT superfamily N-acetyltransferase